MLVRDTKIQLPPAWAIRGGLRPLWIVPEAFCCAGAVRSHRFKPPLGMSIASGLKQWAAKYTAQNKALGIGIAGGKRRSAFMAMK